MVTRGAAAYNALLRATNLRWRVFEKKLGWHVDLLLVVAMTAHLLAVNLAGAAPLVCLWLDWRAVRRDDAVAANLGRWLVRQSLIWLSVGIALGLTTLGLVRLIDWQRFAEAAGRIPASRYWFGVAELAFYFVCMGGYLVLWRDGPAPSRQRIWGRRMLGLLAGTNLLYHFPPLFAIIGVLGTRPETVGQAFNFRAAMVDLEVLAHCVHHILASFAVVGVAMMGYALSRARAERAVIPATEIAAKSHEMMPADSDLKLDWRRMAIWGGRVALVPTLLQLLAGTFVLLTLPALMRDRLLGQDLLATILFAASMIAALALMHRLAAVAMGDTQRREIIGAMVLLVVVVLLMVGTLQRARKPIVAWVGHVDAADATVGSPYCDEIKQWAITYWAIADVSTLVTRTQKP